MDALLQVDVSVVIVNWNTKLLLEECLQSVKYHLLADLQIRCQVIVVDNASSDGSQEMVRKQFPAVRLICNSENEGFARASNRGIRVSKGRSILLLNSDAQLVPDAVQRMLRTLDEDTTIGIAGVCLSFPDGTPQFCNGSFPDLRNEFRSLFGMHKWDLSHWKLQEQPVDVDWVSGACLMARREMLEQVGVLDEQFFFSGEEVDLCYRCKQAGWRVVLAPSRPVVHQRAGSTGKTSERILRLYAGRVQYSEKHWSTARTAILKVMIIVSSAAKLTLYGLLSLLAPKYQPVRQLWANVLRGIYNQWRD